MAGEGRKSVKGKRRKPKQFKNDGHSFELKLAVLRALDTATMKEIIERFFPALPAAKSQTKRRNIERWRHQRAKIERMAAKQRTKDNQRERQEGTATSLSTEREREIVFWINERRKDGIPVSSTMLRVRAIEVAQEGGVEGFIGSWSWCRAFMHHHKLSVRARTRQGQVTTGEAATAVSSFSQLVLRTMERLGLSKHTVSAQGTKTVWVRCAGKEKERLTAMLLGDSDGNKYSPFVVVKSARSRNNDRQAENDLYRHDFGRRMWRDILQAPASSHLQIYGNAKGWWNERLSLEFLKHHFGGRSNNNPPVILLWDDMSAHWTKDVTEYAARQRVELLRVPPRFTFCCQPADVAWNKPLKDRLRAKWISELRVRISNNDKVVAPRRSDVMLWLMEAWGALSSQTITSGFRKCRLLSSSIGDGGAVDDEDGSAEAVVDSSLLEALIAQRIVEPGRIRDEDDIEGTSNSEEMQQAQ